MKKTFLLTFIIIISLTLTACTSEENNIAPTEFNPEPMITVTTAETTSEPVPEPSIITTELTVWNMTCKKCVNKITDALSVLDEVIDVSVDLKAETVTIEHEADLDTTLIENIITGEGFNIP